MTKSFVHLHVHDWYSFLDGMSSPETLVNRAKELGMTALAQTNHNHLGGAIEFQKACRKAGIKPLLGCEMYYTEDTSILSLTADERYNIAVKEAEKDGVVIPDKINGKKTTKKQANEIIADYMYDARQYHILFLAKNQNGWKNLVKLQSEASSVCTYNGRYLCDLEMIKKYSDDLIVTTACIGSKFASDIIDKNYEASEELIVQFKEIFGDRFFLEIQPLNIEDQRITNYKYMEFSEKHDIKIVATNDVHYAREEDHDDHDTMLCIGTGKYKAEEDRLRYSNDFWLKTYNEMVETFKDQEDYMFNDEDEAIKEQYREMYMQAIENTNLIADSIDDNINLGSDEDLFPDLDIPFGMTPENYLTYLCYRGLYKYKKKKKHIYLKKYEERLANELEIINSKGFAPYMLAVNEFVSWCKDVKIPVGPGRGSASGSLVLFLLNITKGTDPLEYNLLFFRFLTMDRASPPDIDLDFSYFRRGEVIDHLKDVYGADKVCHIGTYTTMGVKSGLKDVGRVLGVDFGIMNNISKEITDISDDAPSLTFADLDALQEGVGRNDEDKYIRFKKLEERYSEVFRLARLFEGVPRNIGTHASGVLVTPMPVADLFPTRLDPKTGVISTLYTGVELEDLKAIKFDILGLKTLDVLDMTAKAIDKDANLEDYYSDAINLNDPKVFDMVCDRKTDGLFQIESNLFKGVIGDMQPRGINDIIALTSICRPGPLKADMDKAYSNRKNGIEEVVEPLPGTYDILKQSYCTIIYQEDIMLIAQKVAKFDDNQADSYLRKSIAKNRKALMDMCEQWFVYGKLNQAPPEDHDSEDMNQPMYDPEGKYGNPILGGVNNGYDEQALKDFWESIKGYCSYLFNKSHAASYSFLSVLSAYFKYYYPAKFMASLLTMQKETEKIEQYIKVSRDLGIKVLTPDVNNSSVNFAEINGDIVYGLGSIKGVGAASLNEVIENRPYEGVGDALSKVSKKSFNKRVGAALIKAGAFDFESENRYELMHTFHSIRRDKDQLPEIESYNKDICINMEKEVLGTSVTHIPKWDIIEPGKMTSIEFEPKTVSERVDKNGRLMAFVDGVYENTEIKTIIFASTYAKTYMFFDGACKMMTLRGKKDDRGTFIVSSVTPIEDEVFEPFLVSNDIFM